MYVTYTYITKTCGFSVSAMQMAVSHLYLIYGHSTLTGVSLCWRGGDISNLPALCCRCREWPPWSPGKENQANLAIKPREAQPVCSKGTVFSSKHGSPPSYPIPDVKHPFHLQSHSKQLGGLSPVTRVALTVCGAGTGTWGAGGDSDRDCISSLCGGGRGAELQDGAVCPQSVPAMFLSCPCGGQAQMPRTAGVCQHSPEPQLCVLGKSLSADPVGGVPLPPLPCIYGTKPPRNATTPFGGPAVLKKMKKGTNPKQKVGFWGAGQ